MVRRPEAVAVLQVLPALVSGGVERGTVEIAAALTRAGMRALVASAGGPMVAEVEAAGARHILLPLDRKTPLAMVMNARALAHLVRSDAVAIVHARSRFPAWSARWAARATGTAFVTTYHGAYNEGSWVKHRYNAVMAGGDRVIAVSDHVAELVRCRYGTTGDRLRTIPRGVDPAIFDPDAVASSRVAVLQAAWRVPEGRFVVMLPARLTRWKGQGVLLRAVARLLPSPPFVLLVGEGPYRAELERDVVALGLAGHAALPGHAADMPAALLLADLVVHASTDPEAFGRTIIEAQAMRRPVIAADLGAPRETVEEGVTGWRVPPGDPVALAAAISRVVRLPAAERAVVGERSRRAVLGRYTTAAMQAATLAAYRELL